jgi:hypothetical protein
MNKLLGAGGLAAIALFMLLGFLNSGLDASAPATLTALALTVALPAASAGLLVRSHYGERARLAGCKASLCQQTLDTEILRLAAGHGGRLTAIEVATALGLSPEAATEALDNLAIRDHADYAVTDAGLIVYTFPDVQHLASKATAKGVLDA